MKDADRVKLLGTYRTPRVRVGTVLSCEYRDADVIVVGYSEGRIPWPVGRRKGTAARTLVVYGGLAEAVRTESGVAVCHWFGVTAQTVSAWRKALGVGPVTDGTHRLRSDYTGEPWAVAARAAAHAKAQDPGRRAKIAAARRGRPRPRRVLEAAWRANRGREVSAETRARMAEHGRRRAATGQVPNGRVWTPAEDELIRTLPAKEVANRTGRTRTSVYSRRTALGVPDGRTTRWQPGPAVG